MMEAAQNARVKRLEGSAAPVVELHSAVGGHVHINVADRCIASNTAQDMNHGTGWQHQSSRAEVATSNAAWRTLGELGDEEQLIAAEDVSQTHHLGLERAAIAKESALSDEPRTWCEEFTRWSWSLPALGRWGRQPAAVAAGSAASAIMTMKSQAGCREKQQSIDL